MVKRIKKWKKIAKLNKSLDSRFIFYNSGFNVRSTDISASIGLSQFQDLNLFVQSRLKNRNNIIKEINKNEKVKKNFKIIRENINVNPSWFGMPILVSKKLNRNKIVEKLEKLGVETRPIISGNFLKQPAIRKYNIKTKYKMKNSDYVNKYGFFIGLKTTQMKNGEITKLIKIFEKSI